MPRLFTALEIPTSIATQLTLLQGGLPGARWIERENLHLTLCFAGDLEGHIAREFAEGLSKIKSAQFVLQLDELSVFGNSKPRSLYASVKRSDALMELQAAQTRICQQIGIELDRRKFKPHITIARISGSDPMNVASYLSQRGSLFGEPFDVERFVLLSSRDSVGGGPYVIEETYQLRENHLAGT